MGDLRTLLTRQSRSEAERAIQASTRSQYLGNNRVLSMILGGKKFFAMADDTGFSPHMIIDGFWEFWLTKCFAENIRTGDVVLDVGANLGYYTLLAAEMAGPDGHVVALEPNPEVYRFLTESVGVSGHGATVECINAALSGDPGEGTARFFCPRSEPKNGRFVVSGEDEEFLSRHGKVISVDVLGDLSDRFDRLDFVKIDVEGAELGVLAALRPLLDRFSPRVVCECNFSRGYTYQDVCEAMGATRLHHLDYDSRIVNFTPEMAATQRLDDDWLVCLNFKD